jgi:hypothetical protein
VDQVTLLNDRVEERMGQCLLGRDSLVGVEVQHGPQQVDGGIVAARKPFRQILSGKHAHIKKRYWDQKEIVEVTMLH